MTHYTVKKKKVQGGGTTDAINIVSKNIEGLTIYAIPNRIAVQQDVLKKMTMAGIAQHRIKTIKELRDHDIGPWNTDVKGMIIIAPADSAYHTFLLKIAAYVDHKYKYYKLGVWEEFDADSPGYTVYGKKPPLKDLNRNEVMGCMDEVLCVSATLIGAVISDLDFDTVSEIIVTPDYLSLEELTHIVLLDEDLNELLNGTVSKRLIPFFQAFGHEGILCMVARMIVNHNAIKRAVTNMGIPCTVRNSEENSVQPWDAKGIFIGYNAFPRSVSVPNLLHLLYDFSDTTRAATAIQGLRTLGFNKRGPSGNYLFMRQYAFDSLQRFMDMENKITPEVLILPPEERHKWFNENIQPLEDRKSLPYKGNGWGEETKVRPPLVPRDLEKVTQENIDFYTDHSKYPLVDKTGMTIKEEGTYNIGAGGDDPVKGAIQVVSSNAMKATNNTRGVGANFQGKGRRIILPSEGVMPEKKAGNLYIMPQHNNNKQLDSWSQFYFNKDGVLMIALARAEDQPEKNTKEFVRKNST